MHNRFAKIVAVAALFPCFSQVDAALHGTSVHVPVQDTQYSRGASIILNNSSLLTFIAQRAIEQGTVPNVHNFYPGNATTPGGEKVSGNTFHITRAGSLAFLGTTPTTPTSVYFLKGTTVRRLVSLGQAAPGGGIFQQFGAPSANDSGQVAFAASTQGGPGSGIFLVDATGVHAIALYTGQAPAGAGTFTGFSSDVFVTTGQKVAFYASTTGGEGGGLYLGTKSGAQRVPQTAAATTSTINNFDKVLFKSGGSLYLGTPSSSRRIVALGEAAPGGGTFTTIQHVAMNDAGEVAFSAYVKRAQTEEGVFLWTPFGIKSIAQSGLAPGGGTFQIASLFNTFPVLNSNGQVAFTANTSSGMRLFLGDGTDLIKVVGAGDIVSGLAVQNVVLPAPENGGSGHSSFNDVGELAYDAIFKNNLGYFDEMFVFKADSGKPAQLLNISTRMRTETGDNVLIGGFFITGSTPKKVIIRALGPSLPTVGRLADPVLELHKANGTVITNDNWRATQEAEIMSTGIPPSRNEESAIVAILPPGGHTAIVRGQGNATGVGLVEVYDLEADKPARLANISTRGPVQTGDSVMIGGFIVGGSQRANVIVRALGPSLPVTTPLQNPVLELRDQNGALISNDDWRSTQESEITATNLEPKRDQESAILASLAPGSYSAVVRGKNNTTGVGLVDAYLLP